MEFSKGQVIWFVPINYRLVIRCTITDIDDYFRKKSPEAYLFYDVDEPVGHYLDEDEIYLTREEAEDSIDESDTYVEDLMSWRRRRLKFITSTWKDAPEEEKDIEKLLKNYSDKQQGVDWFLVPL